MVHFTYILHLKALFVLLLIVYILLYLTQKENKILKRVQKIFFDIPKNMPDNYKNKRIQVSCMIVRHFFWDQ